jgi:hypothetical protein
VARPLRVFRVAGPESDHVRFRCRAPVQHGTPSRIGILLINLGTPAAPTPMAVRAYLKQFLSDPRWWSKFRGRCGG